MVLFADSPFEVIGQITVGVFGFVACFAVLMAIVTKLRSKKPPRLAGTDIRELGEGIDISKRYDIVYSGGSDYGTQLLERLSRVLIVGYVGREDDESVGKMYMRSRWLVVTFTDGRKAYLMPHAIVSLQESAPIGD